MFENPLIAIDYASPKTGRRWHLFITPISWPFAALLFFIWTWPFWFSLNSFDLFVFGRAVHVLLGAVGAVVVCAVFVGRRMIFERDLQRTDRGAELGRRRVCILIIASAAFIIAHACAAPQKLVFLFSISRFENARALTTSVPVDGMAVPHPPIGTYDVNSVARASTGEVGFSCGHATAIVWVPSGTATPNALFYPVEAQGNLWGNWYWFAFS